MTPLEIAEKRCAHLELEAQQLFLLMFEHGRAGALADTEMTAWQLRESADYSVLLAGYMEGLASMRQPEARLECGSYDAYRAHLARGEATDPLCRAANAIRVAQWKVRRRRRRAKAPAVTS